MKLIILSAVLFIANFKYAYLQSDFSEQEQTESNEITRTLDFNEIKKTFKLSKDEVSAFTNSFESDKLELIWPATWEECQSSGLFIVSAKPKDTVKSEMLVKFQKKSGVKSWFNEKDKSTECSFIEKNKAIPMEYYISKEMSGKPRFAQFYADDSYYKGSRITYLTSHYFKNSMTLNEWFKNKTSSRTSDKKEVEKNLKLFLRQMHEALVALKKKDYIYTDFKPENVLINMNNNKGSSFLMNMGNVVTLNKDKMSQICTVSKEYFPPSNDQVDIDNKVMIKNFLSQSKNKPDNLLTWTFCSSIMSLVCPEFDKRRDSYFKNRKIHAALKGSSSSLTKLIKCQETSFKYSTKLIKFLDSCLVKDSKISKFEDIVNQEWFRD